MKKVFIFILTFVLVIFPVKAIELELYSSNAILYNLDEDKILYEKESKEKVAIASLTKIMTAIVAIENIADLDAKVTLINDDFKSLVEENASVAGFEVGEVLIYRDLLYGLLLPSGADAAQALTRLIAGNRTNFVALMNEKALSLGMNDTHFENETGLDSQNHYSTVGDVAIMFKYALQNATLKEIMTTESYKTSDNRHILKSTINNFKKTYNLDMDYLLGGKTGTTSKAGRCLASFASANGTNYILITVGASVNNKPETMLDAQKVYAYFMDNFKRQTILTTSDKILTLNTNYAKEKTLDFYAKEDLTKYVPNDFQKSDLEITYVGKENINFNTPRGEKLGTITISYKDEVLRKEDIFLNTNLTFDLTAYLKKHYGIILAGLIILILGVIITFSLIFKRHKKFS